VSTKAVDVASVLYQLLFRPRPAGPDWPDYAVWPEHGIPRTVLLDPATIAARDRIGENIRINAMSPGASDTDMSLRPGETPADRAERGKGVIPIGRVGSKDEIANAVLWLASDESSFTVGHDLVVDGGTTA
jgi:NAD(P)-dependent dehydrogenase (short-subunit alcohol dehydrogenase family)